MKQNTIFQFIKAPLRLIMVVGTVVLVALLFNIFFKFSPHQKRSENDLHAPFLEHLMIREWGLYTLLGSKPITIFDIDPFVIRTEKELKEHYQQLEKFLEKAKNDPEVLNPKKLTLPTYKDYKKNWEAELPSFSSQELWESWERSSFQLNPKFLLIQKDSPYGGVMGLFINIPSLVYTLYHHREEFFQRTGVNYDPAEIVYEIKDSASLFWNQVFKDHFLTGIICGYGQKGAYLFDWSGKHLSSILKDKINFSLNNCASKQDKNVRLKKNVTPKDLPLPVFFHFGLVDQAKNQYQLEQEKIIDFFKGKDFISTTLEILLDDKAR